MPGDIAKAAGLAVDGAETDVICKGCGKPYHCKIRVKYNYTTTAEKE